MQRSKTGEYREDRQELYQLGRHLPCPGSILNIPYGSPSLPGVISEPHVAPKQTKKKGNQLFHSGQAQALGRAAFVVVGQIAFEYLATTSVLLETEAWGK